MNKIKPPISDKDFFRKEAKSRIQRKTEEEKFQESKSICEELIGLQAVQNASHIYVYQSLSDEVCLDTLIEWALAKKKHVFCCPPVKGDACKAGGFNAFRTFGAKSTKSASEIYFSPLPEKGIILIPGRAFTLSGKRIGRGGGWYDTFLAKNSHLLTIGVCFECQIFPELPQDIWDVKIQKVIGGSFCVSEKENTL